MTKSNQGPSARSITTHTRLGQAQKISGNTLELGARHGNGGLVIGIRDTKVLLVNVHELDFVLAHPLTSDGIEPEADDIRVVLSPDDEHLIALGSSHHLGKGAKVEAEGDVAVTPVWSEGVCLEHHGDKGDVGVVHGLEGHSLVIAIKVAVLDQVLDGLDNLKRGVRRAFSGRI